MSTREAIDKLDKLYFLEGLSILFSPAVRNIETGSKRSTMFGGREGNIFVTVFGINK